MKKARPFFGTPGFFHVTVRGMFALIRVAAPVSLMYLGMMLMGFVDLVMVGKLGAAQLGGVGVGNSVYSWVMIAAVGLLSGMDFPAAHAIGAGNPRLAHRVFSQGLWISLLWGIVCVIACRLFVPVLAHFGTNPEVLPFAKQYFAVSVLSLPFVFLFNACRSYLQARNLVQYCFWILVGANILNYLLLDAVIFGRHGSPAFGFEGVAWATFFCRAVMAIAAFGVIAYLDHKDGKFFRSEGFRFDLVHIREIFRLGIPSGLQMMMEVGVFSLSTLLASHFSAESLAAHQIVLTTASIAFMIPLGISMASGALIGQAMGQRNFALAKSRGNQAFLLGIFCMTVTSFSMLLFPKAILGLYHVDAEVVSKAAALLWVAGIFQYADAIQVIGTGCLRGLGNTRLSAIGNFIGHWLMGCPLGLLLAFHYGKEVFGIWVGLSVGLIAVSVLVYGAWRKLTRQFV